MWAHIPKPVHVSSEANPIMVNRLTLRKVWKELWAEIPKPVHVASEASPNMVNGLTIRKVWTSRKPWQSSMEVGLEAPGTPSAAWLTPFLEEVSEGAKGLFQPSPSEASRLCLQGCACLHGSRQLPPLRCPAGTDGPCLETWCAAAAAAASAISQ